MLRFNSGNQIAFDAQRDPDQEARNPEQLAVGDRDGDRRRGQAQLWAGGQPKADVLLIATSLERVALDFGTPRQIWVDELTLDEAKRSLAEGVHFAAGSMAPKIEAVIRYLEGGGGVAVITDPANVGRAMRGEAGTRIRRR